MGKTKKRRLNSPDREIVQLTVGRRQTTNFDKQILASISNETTLSFYSMRDGKLLSELIPSYHKIDSCSMISARWMDPSKGETCQLLVSTSDGRLIVYDFDKEKVISIIDTDQKKPLIDFVYCSKKESARIICLFDDGSIGTYSTRNEKFRQIMSPSVTTTDARMYRRLEQVDKNRLLICSDGIAEFDVKTGELTSKFSPHTKQIKEFGQIWKTNKYFTISDFDNFIPIYQYQGNSVEELTTLQSIENIHLKWCDMIVEDIFIVHSVSSVFLFKAKNKENLFPFRQIRISLKDQNIDISFVNITPDSERLQIFYKTEKNHFTQQSISFKPLIDGKRTKELATSNISVSQSKKNLMVIDIDVNDENKYNLEYKKTEKISKVEGYVKNVNSTTMHPIVAPQMETFSCDSGRGCSVTPDIQPTNHTSLTVMKDSMTMQQRVDLLKNREHRQNVKHINVDTNSIAGLLKKSLVDNNIKFINYVLSQRNKLILRNTLQDIDEGTSVKFLEVLCRLLRSSTQEKELSIVRWLNHLLMIHGRNIRNVPSARHLLENARELLKKRTSLYSAIAELQGRFLLFTQQQQELSNMRDRDEPSEPCVFQYVDDEEEIDDDLIDLDFISTKSNSDDDDDDDNPIQNNTPVSTDAEDNDVEMKEEILAEIKETSERKLKFVEGEVADSNVHDVRGEEGRKKKLMKSFRIK